MTLYFIQMQKQGDSLAQVEFDQEKERDKEGTEKVALTLYTDLSLSRLGGHGIQWRWEVDMAQLLNSSLHVHLLELAVSC